MPMDEEFIKALGKLGEKDGRDAKTAKDDAFMKSSEEMCDMVSTTVWSFYCSCVSKGFNKPQALGLAQAYMQTLWMTVLTKTRT